MERNKTLGIAHIDRCKTVCLENLTTDVTDGLVTCVALLNEWRDKRNLAQHNMELQRSEIIHMLRTARRNPLKRNLVLYTEHPELYAELSKEDLPDGILFTSTHQYIQRRLDLKRLKEEMPEVYTRYLKNVTCKGKILTGRELMEIRETLS